MIFPPIGSSTSIRHDSIEVKIYGGTFHLLQGLLVGGERGSKNINMVSELAKCLDHGGEGYTLIIL